MSRNPATEFRVRRLIRNPKSPIHVLLLTARIAIHFPHQGGAQPIRGYIKASLY